MSVRSILEFAISHCDTEAEAHSTTRAAGSFLARAADVATHLREDSLYLGRVSVQDERALDSVQRIAFVACRTMVHFPVYGESMVRAALMGASDACYSAANILYRRRIAPDVVPLVTTQEGADRELAPLGMPASRDYHVGILPTNNGAWIQGLSD